MTTTGSVLPTLMSLLMLRILLGDSPLGQVDVTLVLVDPDDHHGLGPAHPDELVDAPDPPPGELGQQDHALYVIVLQEVDVCAHVGDTPNIHHHHIVHLGVFLLVEPAGDDHGWAGALL